MLDLIEPLGESRDWRYIVLHHTGEDFGTVSSIDAAYQKRKDQFGNNWLGIGYHFVIGNGNGMADGRVEPTFRWEEQLDGTHAGSRIHNRLGIGICLVGDFEKSRPTKQQVAAVKELVAVLMNRYRISPINVVRHLDVAATRCPGRLFPLDEFRGLPAEIAVDSAGRATEDVF